MLSPGPHELLLIFLFILLIFGGRKIPEVARGLGKGMREFKRGLNDIKDDVENSSSNSDTQEKAEEESGKSSSNIESDRKDGS